MKKLELNYEFAKAVKQYSKFKNKGGSGDKEKFAIERQIEMCKNKAKNEGGDIHGWFDAFNPKFNWSHSADEVEQWFEEEGFKNIKLRMIKQNINMNGILE